MTKDDQIKALESNVDSLLALTDKLAGGFIRLAEIVEDSNNIESFVLGEEWEELSAFKAELQQHMNKS